MQLKQMTASSQYDYLLKVVLVGDTGVGKTTFFKQVLGQVPMRTHQSTIGIDLDCIILPVNEKKVCIQIWDTAGMERYKSLTANYYVGANLLFLFYDLTRKQSFHNLRTWLASIKERVKGTDCKIVLIGNKLDLTEERQVSMEEAAMFAQENSFSYFEVSALYNTGPVVVTEILQDCIQDILLHTPPYLPPKKVQIKPAVSWQQWC